MLAFLSLASLLALSQAAILPAGVSAASCVNYPFCGPSPDDGAYLVPGGAAVLAAQKAVQHQHYIASIANPPIVPGTSLCLLFSFHNAFLKVLMPTMLL